jgi:transcriptional regulator with XRE-family HTH domain
MTPNRVIQARFLLGWSTEALARASRVSPAQLAAYEAGGWIHPLQLASVSRALRIEGVEFLNGVPTLETPRDRRSRVEPSTHHELIEVSP